MKPPIIITGHDQEFAAWAAGQLDHFKSRTAFWTHNWIFRHIEEWRGATQAFSFLTNSRWGHSNILPALTGLL